MPVECELYIHKSNHDNIVVDDDIFVIDSIGVVPREKLLVPTANPPSPPPPPPFLAEEEEKKNWIMSMMIVDDESVGNSVPLEFPNSSAQLTIHQPQSPPHGLHCLSWGGGVRDKGDCAVTRTVVLNDCSLVVGRLTQYQAPAGLQPVLWVGY